MVFFSAVFPAWHRVSRKVWFLQYVCETLLWCPWSLLQRRTSFWHKVFWWDTKSISLKRFVNPSSYPFTVLTKYLWVVCYKISPESLDCIFSVYSVHVHSPFYTMTQKFQWATESVQHTMWRLGVIPSTVVCKLFVYSDLLLYFPRPGINKTNKQTSLQNCCTL